ncbi:glucose-1-phosphate thymidylyltransferase [Acidilobus sp.]|uniref:glucose-1-phosphate thymidylyltransferase n=1 Tax=Acidilobus sp. TaxID=1872109 RepID=UPI003D029B21
MKGVLLHGGQGTRLRPLTFSGPKQLIPVANKPVSQHVIEDLASIGITDIAVILGETFPELVVSYYGDGSRFGVNITYIYQGRALGIAHAISLAEPFVKDEPFVVYLGDDLLQGGIGKYMRAFEEGDYDAMVILKEVEDPRAFGVAEIKDERIVRLVEKPANPPSNLAIVGVYFFRPIVFDVIRSLRPSARGELEVTDAIQALIDRGYRVGYAIHEGWWLDTGKKDDVILANQLVLDEKARRRIDPGATITNSKVEGRVEISEGAVIRDSVVRGPASIAGEAVIESSFIGPYTSIGKGAVVRAARIQNSVILERAEVSGVELEDSLVGRLARVTGRSNGNGRRIRLSVGDYSTIEVD